MTKDNIKDKVCMVIDDGMFLELASKLGESFKEVLYYTVWEEPYPKMNKGMIGYGMPNITRVNSIWEHFDEVDIFVFPCVYFGDLQEHIESLGKRVWGSRTGEDMEIDRDRMKKHMNKLGLPVGKYEVVTGMDALREYLKKNEDVYVKISQWRGHFETFNSPNYKMIEPKLDAIEHEMGPLKYITEFIVDHKLDNKVEIGYDGYTIDGKYPSKSVVGIEVKDLGYVGEMREYKDIPKEVTEFNTKISDTFKGYGYRGFFSTEIRVGEDKKAYMIDGTMRCPSPPTELCQELYSNLAEIIWYGSEGKVIDPIPAAKWGVEIMMYSEWAQDNWLPVYFPDEIKQFVKLMNAVRIKDTYYIAPQSFPTNVIGAVIGLGNTLEEALEHVKKNAEQIEAHQLVISLETMGKAQEEMDKLTKFGIKLFSNG
jgi:hypothetical protein